MWYGKDKGPLNNDVGDILKAIFELSSASSQDTFWKVQAPESKPCDRPSHEGSANHRHRNSHQRKSEVSFFFVVVVIQVVDPIEQFRTTV
jgi:hypothetical protein